MQLSVSTIDQQELLTSKLPCIQIANILLVSTCSINPGRAYWHALLRILRQPSDVEFEYYAEMVPDYQLNPEYLPKGLNWRSYRNLHMLV